MAIIMVVCMGPPGQSCPDLVLKNMPQRRVGILPYFRVYSINKGYWKIWVLMIPENQSRSPADTRLHVRKEADSQRNFPDVAGLGFKVEGLGFRV